MKLTDYIILFVIITLPFVIVSDLRTKNSNFLAYKKISMDKVLDAAAEDAASQMVERSTNQALVINKEKAVKFFLNTLYINMGVENDEIAQKKVTGYIPVIIVVDYKGYHILSNQRFKNANGDEEIKLVWHPQKPYSVKKDDYVFTFAIDLNYVSIYTISSQEFEEGTYNDIREKFPGVSYIQDKDIFDQMRRDAIVDSIKRDVNECINRHNDIARQFGITYNFSLPNIKNGDWERSVDDYGVLAFFQGMPVGVGEYYNNFALGGSRIFKAAHYYVLKDPANNFQYYHRGDCPKLKSNSNNDNNEDDNKSTIVDSKKEAALEGYFPCEVCNP